MYFVKNISERNGCEIPSDGGTFFYSIIEPLSILYKFPRMPHHTQYVNSALTFRSENGALDPVRIVIELSDACVLTFRVHIHKNTSCSLCDVL